MKIRNGYVSNSSSSSFLILCNGIEDFKKFKKFEGYFSLKRDILDLIKNEDENVRKCKEHILSTLQSFSYQTIRNIIEEYKYATCFTTDFSDLIYRFEIEDEQCPSIKIMFDFSNKLYEFVDSNNLIILNDDNWITANKKRDKLYKYSCTIEPSEVAKEKIANEIYDNLTKNMRLFSIEYSDDYDAGSYMEHEFMPFIARNPERNYQIHCINQH